MRYSLFVLLTALIGCGGNPGENGAGVIPAQDKLNSPYNDSIAAVTLVQDFFKAFDEKNTMKLDSLMIPSTKIIHHNGTTTDAPEIIQIIEDTKDWWPRTRKLSDFEFTTNGNFLILGLKNEVTFSLPDNRKVYEPYNETWIFEKISVRWLPIRCHYSKITAEKHTEDVK